jgi:outer membrane protein assembly factor BamB
VRPALAVPALQHVFGAFTLAVFTSGLAAAQAGDEWPMIGGDPLHTGTASGPPPPYRRLWETPVDESGPVSGPVVAGGSVVVVTPDSVIALASETRTVNWERPREPGPVAPAAIGEGLVVYPEGSGEEAAVVGASLQDGDEVWRFATRSPVTGGATIADGLAYLSDRDGTVRAVTVATGESEWRFEAAGRVDSPPAVSGDLVVVAAEGFKSGRAAVHALDARSGEEEWRFSPERIAIGASTVSISNDLAVVGLGDLRTHALEVRTGTARWSARSRAPFSPRMAPSFGGDVLIGDRLGYLYLLDGVSGDERWIFRVPGSLMTASPAIAGSTALIGDSSGQLSGIDLASGHLIWKEQLGERPLGPIAIAEDRIYVTSEDGRVIALVHDRGGVLVDEASPTTLFWGRAILNFAVAFTAMLLGIVGFFRWILRRREASAPGQTGS